MRWKRVCVDIAGDGEVLSGSVEWHPDVGADKGPDAITVMPYMPDATPEQMFVAVLAMPWYQPELPFPQSGWTHFGEAEHRREHGVTSARHSKKW